MTTPQLQALATLLQGRRLVALTGAGCSTESGIPDYRGPKTRHKARNPTRYQDYVKTPEARSRYWMRSSIGWPRMRAAEPNATHHALATMESRGVLRGLITQNVDGLHQKAGSRRVIELHGALAEVVCLSCQEIESRDGFQRRLLAQNPWAETLLATPAQSAPDGDVDIEPPRPITPPGCRRCFDGMLKPHVVFFGENVPTPRVQRAFDLLDEAEALLVAGSSLAVYSGLRFVRRAHEKGIPIAILTLGETRGDELATLKVEARLGPAMQWLNDNI